MCVQLLSREDIEILENDDRSLECQCVLELCPICDLGDSGPCSACNGRGWLSFDREY